MLLGLRELGQSPFWCTTCEFFWNACQKDFVSYTFFFTQIYQCLPHIYVSVSASKLKVEELRTPTVSHPDFHVCILPHPRLPLPWFITIKRCACISHHVDCRWIKIEEDIDLIDVHYFRWMSLFLCRWVARNLVGWIWELVEQTWVVSFMCLPMTWLQTKDHRQRSRNILGIHGWFKTQWFQWITRWKKSSARYSMSKWWAGLYFTRGQKSVISAAGSCWHSMYVFATLFPWRTGTISSGRSQNETPW